MPFTPQRIAALISLAIAVSVQPAHARGDIEYRPYQPYDLIDAQWAFEDEFDTPPTPGPYAGYLIGQASTYNGVQVAKVLEPALLELLSSGELTSEELKELQKVNDALAAQPGGIGAALEQLAGSQNANLLSATHAVTSHTSSQLLSSLRNLPDDDKGRFWVQGLSHGGQLDQRSGSAGLKHATLGLMLGADWAVDNAWRVGVMGAKSTSDLKAPRFCAELDSLHLGAYAVRQDGPLAVRLGAIYGTHAGTNRRNVNLLDYKDSLKSSYDAQSQTLFSELGYQLGSQDLYLEPFAGLGYQRHHRDSFKESGGLTALNVGAQTQQNLNSTVGLRLATVYRFDDQVSLRPHLSAGWKHLYGEVDSQVRQTYRNTPVALDGFTITGTSLDRNSLDVKAGLDLALSNQHTLGLAYSGRAGTHSRDHGMTGQWTMSF
ncbi:autotransporter outer membrane beta-barrel domain-containing protein [Pseudomonas paralactis]|uniref:Autotransporter outer membrane beta-barrel domain-containing protein n=1 Tax=Pseudomonas paralactis TaxID=1615673 RepID=A0ABS0UXF4_9PSED|nr:autotransporter outer membrane beta-barrel domain-containing protein [Pseudomonas paralactis]MBI6632719.1 autotransporter outer membrane beta-barrel domain-containing protein [Pseudomonas paralactis]